MSLTKLNSTRCSRALYLFAFLTLSGCINEFYKNPLDDSQTFRVNARDHYDGKLDHSKLDPSKYCDAIINWAKEEKKNDKQFAKRFLCESTDSDGFSILVALQNSMGGLYPTGRFNAIAKESEYPLDLKDTPNFIADARVPKIGTSKFPAVGILLKHDGAGTQGKHCTATLIGQNHLLTAAHCFIEIPEISWSNSNTNEKWQLFCLTRISMQHGDRDNLLELLKDCAKQDNESSVFLNKSTLEELSRNIFNQTRNSWTFRPDGQSARRIKRVVIHHEYSVQTTDAILAAPLHHSPTATPIYDLAVVELEAQSGEFGETTYFGTGNSNPPVSPTEPADNWLAVGFGSLGTKIQTVDAGTKNIALLKERSNCMNLSVSTSAPSLKHQFICWKFQDPEKPYGTVCGGDSGGPILSGNRMIGVISAGSDQVCNADRSKRNDRTIPVLGWATKLDSKLIQWIKCISNYSLPENSNCESCSNNCSEDETILLADNRSLCNWSVQDKFPHYRSMKPTQAFDLPNHDYRHYRFCANLTDSSKLSVTLNGTKARSFDPWRPLEFRTNNIDLYAHRNNESDNTIAPADDNPNILEKLKLTDINHILLGRPNYHGKASIIGRSTIDCLEEGASNHAACSLALKTTANHLNSNKVHPRKHDLGITVKREHYEGIYQLGVSLSQ